MFIMGLGFRVSRFGVQCNWGCWGFRALLGGSWDSVTTYNWTNNPTYDFLHGLIGVTPIVSRVRHPVISNYLVPWSSPNFSDGHPSIIGFRV